MDMHTHFLRDGTPIRAFVRAARGGRQGGLEPGAGRQAADDRGPRCSRTTSRRSSSTATPRWRASAGSYSVDPKFSFLTNEMKFDAREKINKEAGTRRMFSHAIFTPGWAGWLDKVDEENETLQARLVEGLHDRRQHQQAPLEVPVPAGRREGDVPVLREAGEGHGEVPGSARASRTSASTRACSRRRSRRSSRTCSATATSTTSARRRRTGRSSTSSSTTRRTAGSPAPAGRQRTPGTSCSAPAASTG